MKRLLHLRRLWLLLFIPCALILTLCASRWPPPLQSGMRRRFIRPFLRHPPFDLIASLLPCGMPCDPGADRRTYASGRLYRASDPKPGTARVPCCKIWLNLICIAGILWFSFTVCCGINYSRYPFAQVCGLTVRDSSVEELTGLLYGTAETLSALRPGLTEDENGVMALSGASPSDTAADAKEAYAKLAEKYPTLPDHYGAPKPVFFSRAMSWADITGVFFLYV